jgi:2-keto-4-pentenoate hydratase/2-oxohepta-3-ene-1,7-dioic acid hydratase in catechol pathway
MKLYLGLTEGSAPHQTRIFGATENGFLDLSLAYAAYLAGQGAAAQAYELGGFYFPATIAGFIERGAQSVRALAELGEFVRNTGPGRLRGPGGEKIFYAASEIRWLPPFPQPKRSFVIGFSDKARAAGMPAAEIPTGFYKLPQTFVTAGAPIVWPRFAEELDVDGCLAIVIGKAGRRIEPARAWDYIAGATLLIDVTARDINRREGATTNNLLGKNFPSSTSLGPAFLPVSSRAELQTLDVELSVDGKTQQRFNIGQCVFGPEEIIARWSIIGLHPGDFLAIGASMTRANAQLANFVPVRAGALVRCRSESIGELMHQVLSPQGVRP